jgi:GTP-binding protein
MAGDIVAVTGMSELNVGETITSIESPTILPMMTVDEPTISMQFIANNGPFAGSEGKYVTTRNIRERLWKEIKSNVALRVEETESADTFKVSGRGELHLSVLIETMRREGFEMCVSQPQVIFRDSDEGKLEPYEDLLVDVDDPYVGVVIEKLGRRAGRMKDMGPSGQGRTRIEFTIPSRGLIGYRSEFLTDTRGTGILNHSFKEYAPYAGPLKGRQNGVLIVQEQGETNTYALFSLQERGILLMGTGERVYAGQIVGIHSRDNDLIVNPNKTKKLTNIRTTAADEKLFLTPPRILSLEAALEFINDDELVEVTPKSIRVRKRYLDHNVRKRFEKVAAAVADD